MDAGHSKGWGLAAGVLIGGAALLRVLYLALWCPLDLAPDEAHYWDWSRHLDWSYYSKGPLVAVLIRISCFLFSDLSRALTGADMLAVRLPAVLCGTLLLWAVYRLTVEVHRNEKWGLAVVGLALTLPLISAGSLLMTIDAPYTCAWAWALVFVYRALFGQERSDGTIRHWFGWWVLAGLCVALGVLAKHTMVLFVPMVGLFLMARRVGWGGRPPRFCEPGLNRSWAGFVVMALVGGLGGLPILLWNMQNGWVTLQHTKGHAGLVDGPAIHWLGPLRYLGVQCALLLGYWFLVGAGALWAYRPGKETDPRRCYLWWMSLPMFAFFFLFSFKNGGGEANWPVAAYLAGLVLMVPWLAGFLTSPRVAVRRGTWAFCIYFCVLGLALTLLMHDTRTVQPLLARLSGIPSDRQPTPIRRFDPTCRLKGWQTLARAVDEVRERLRYEGIEPLVASGHWSLPGEIAFYGQGQPTVYCLGSGLGDRHSQYDLWRPNPVLDGEQFLGKTFVLVGLVEQQVAAAFERVETGRRVVHYEAGQPVAIWYVTVGHGFRGLRGGAGNHRY